MNQTTLRTSFSCLPLVRLATLIALLIGGASILTTPAAAVVNGSVRSACMSDYFSYCAGLEVGSAALRSCMNKAGPKLSTSCVNALVAAGEVSRAEVNRRNTRTASASTAKARSRYSSRACVAGPARPGARYSNTCRSNVASARGKVSRRYATLR